MRKLALTGVAGAMKTHPVKGCDTRYAFDALSDISGDYDPRFGGFEDLAAGDARAVVAGRRLQVRHRGARGLRRVRGLLHGARERGGGAGAAGQVGQWAAVPAPAPADIAEDNWMAFSLTRSSPRPPR